MKPEETEEFILLEQIVVTEEFLSSHPNVEKTQQIMDHVKQTGYLDEPTTINRKTKILTGGYRRYIVAKKVEMYLSSIVYEK
ncbi:hypothetical protein [Bacillus songklensis]|uniref:hypothetical protein n=1 Tax=Bacillus songklensis TaxID=1069116 RepID=UPI0036730195